MVRRNGLSLPLHPLQILGWAAIAVMTVFSYVFVVPSLSSNPRVRFIQLVFLCTYSLTQLIVLTVGGALTCLDPTDPLVSGSSSEEAQIVCEDCHSAVHFDSKHCMRCNRCVRRFDHHCKWLNNDIGRRNYPSFWVLLSAIEVSAVLQLVFALMNIIEMATEGVEDGKELSLACQCVLVAISAAVLVAVSQLVSFHVYLRRHHLTTYEWIKRRRQTNLEVAPNLTELQRESADERPPTHA